MPGATDDTAEPAPQHVVVVDGEALLPDGSALANVHDEVKCHGRTCVVHAPTNHEMSTWWLDWDSDHGMLVRICEHAIAHPDPDQLPFWLEAGSTFIQRRAFLAAIMGVDSAEAYASQRAAHPCDGCCHSAWAQQRQVAP